MSSKLPIIVLLGVPWRILETWRLRAANLTNPKMSKRVSIKLVADGTLWYSITQNVNDSGCVCVSFLQFIASHFSKAPS